MDKYYTKDGIYYIDFELSKLEFDLFREFEDMLLEKGYKYLSLPSAGSWDVVEKQEVVTCEYSLGIDERQALFGSAEQGFLEYFQDKKVTEEMFMFSFNECFRNEQSLDGLQRLREFKKLENVVFECKAQGILGGQSWGLLYIPSNEYLGEKKLYIYDEKEFKSDSNNVFIRKKLKKNWFFYYDDWDGKVNLKGKVI